MTPSSRAKRPPIRPRKPRVPKLSHTSNQGIGWHVSYRDPTTGLPIRHRFGVKDKSDEAKARVLYYAWVAQHLGQPVANPDGTPLKTKVPRVAKPQPVLQGCLLEVGSAVVELEKSRVRPEGEAKRRGTIDPDVYADRVRHVKAFLTFLNSLHGPGAVGAMRLAELSMQDVEAYNRHLAKQGYSASNVARRMQTVKAIIDRAGRPEHGQQVLPWNWDSRDVVHGKPTGKRTLPTVDQLKALLKNTDLRGQTMIWMGIGLGFGQKDLSVVRVGQISDEAYDLRRGKTGVERYGETPPLVWAYVSALIKEERRREGDLLFITQKGMPLVHGGTDAVNLWWDKLRRKIKAEKTLGGFYTLRHLGATEYGSRPGCSIGEMRRWLGHAASSNMADVYMRPIPPEIAAVVKWVRGELAKSTP